jgi:hypothetical protein
MHQALKSKSVSCITFRNLISRKVHNRAPRWYGHAERMIEEDSEITRWSCHSKEENDEDHLHIVAECQTCMEDRVFEKIWYGEQAGMENKSDKFLNEKK